VRAPTVRAHLGSRWAHTGGRVRRAQVRRRLRGEFFFAIYKISLLHYTGTSSILSSPLGCVIEPRNVQKSWLCAARLISGSVSCSLYVVVHHMYEHAIVTWKKRHLNSRIGSFSPFCLQFVRWNRSEAK
jgi:hypothetical protein